MENVDIIVSKLKQLSNVGIRIAIDDFGTGHSSLALLQKLPVKTLKIDRIFVDDIDKIDPETSVVQAIVHMARGLKLDMIAVGVETEEQVRRLRQMGCDNVQGYIFGHGIPADETRRLLLKTQSLLDKDKKFQLEDNLV